MVGAPCYFVKMSDVVWVTLIGVLGTFVAGIAGPLVKDRVDRSSRERSERRREQRSTIATITQLLRKMSRLQRGTPAWLSFHSELSSCISTLSVQVSKGEMRVAQFVEHGAVFAHLGGSAVESTTNQTMVGAVCALLVRWYRGEKKANELFDLLSGLYDSTHNGLIDGTLMPGGVPLRDDELTDSELAERFKMRGDE